jgi:5-bromo-4-chloroindolyl phosphate hydrolysis protein
MSVKRSIITGSFIGIAFATSISFILKFLPLTYWSLVMILYMYVVVGALAAFFVDRKLTKHRPLEESFKK